jgi:transposase, IS5 family
MIQAANTLSDERAEFLINDRLSFMRFLGLGLSDRVPDARTIWLFREKLIKAGAIEGVCQRFAAAVREAGYIAKGGQIVDASLVAAPKQRSTEDEKKAITLRHKDRDARWTVKFSKAKPKEDGTRTIDIAILTFGDKNHISIDRRVQLIRRWDTTDASCDDGTQIRKGLLDKTNTVGSVWADTAYRSQANEEQLFVRGKVSQIHRKKPKGKPMPRHIAKANARKSLARSKVEHVFAGLKHHTAPAGSGS